MVAADFALVVVDAVRSSTLKELIALQGGSTGGRKNKKRSINCEGQQDGTAYCQEWAHSEFICRSTGGGNENRKACVPEG